MEIIDKHTIVCVILNPDLNKTWSKNIQGIVNVIRQYTNNIHALIEKASKKNDVEIVMITW